MNLKGRSFLSLKDFTKDEIMYLVDLAARLKKEKEQNIFKMRLRNKNIALIFEKPSTRTRCAFTVAAADEGAHPEYLGVNDIQLGAKESLEDTARVLGRMFDGIEFRGFEHEKVEKLAKYSGVPVWNGLTDTDHPTQVLADFLTIQEQIGHINGVNLTYIGDGRNNMANALLMGASKTSMNITICCPKELEPAKEILDMCKEFAVTSGSNITVTNEPDKGAKNADVIYTDVWYSMGEEDKAKERIELLKPYQVNKELFAKADRENVFFMHCLPAIKGTEVTEDIFEKYADIVFDQAENRMHTIKAVMLATLMGEN